MQIVKAKSNQVTNQRREEEYEDERVTEEKVEKVVEIQSDFWRGFINERRSVKKEQSKMNSGKVMPSSGKLDFMLNFDAPAMPQKVQPVPQIKPAAAVKKVIEKPQHIMIDKKINEPVVEIKVEEETKFEVPKAKRQKPDAP